MVGFLPIEGFQSRFDVFFHPMSFRNDMYRFGGLEFAIESGIQDQEAIARAQCPVCGWRIESKMPSHGPTRVKGEALGTICVHLAREHGVAAAESPNSRVA